MSSTVSERTLSRIYEVFSRKGPGAVVTDSRSVGRGDLFFALRGDRFDGNLYAAGALERGAAIAVVDNQFALSEQGKEIAGDDRFVVVEDTLEALQELASMHRIRLGIPIIALTGSNGKTTTKELLARVLSAKFKVGATCGNLNNHIGVPLTLLSFDGDTQIGIVEMGANHPHEIELLCRIARPDFGLITNIGKAHLEGFGSEDGVRRAKGELFDYLALHGGKAFCLTDDPVLAGMVEDRTGLDAVLYSPGSLSLSVAGQGSEGIILGTAQGDIATHMVGDYNLRNIAAAIAVGEFFGVDLREALDAVVSYLPDNNRSQKIRTSRNTLYMDAYNANPSSMSAAIANFVALDVPSKVLILGDMRELGEYSAAEHSAIVGQAVEAGFQTVFTVGEFFKKAAEATDYLSFGDVQVLITYIQGNPLSGLNILIKGSRGIELEKLLEVL